MLIFSDLPKKVSPTKIDVKKIPQLHIAQGNIIGELFRYIPAVLKEYTEYWCIEYYVKKLNHKRI